MLDARKTTADLRTLYKGKDTKKALSALILGDKGVGKTTMLDTCRKPVLHICFDPDGEQLPCIRAMSERGEILSLVHYQGNDPAAFRQFEKDWPSLADPAFISQFGTTCLDSLTTFGETGVEYVLSNTVGTVTEKGKPHGEKMELQDWGTFGDLMRRWIKSFLNLPTDVLILGHIRHDKDEVTGRIVKEVMLPGRSAQNAPIWVSELWYLETKAAYDAKGVTTVTRRLVTGNTGDYKGSTRIGGSGKLDLYEPADIKAILAKVGLPTADKPALPMED